MGKRLIDVDKLHAVLLEEREAVWNSTDNDRERDAKFSAVSDCLGIVNHMPEYDAEADYPVLNVSDIIHIYFSRSLPFVLKRQDTGREYRKFKNALDEKYNWEVTGMFPRIKTDGDNRAHIEMVLWCKDRGTAIKELYDEVSFEMLFDKFGCRKEENK